MNEADRLAETVRTEGTRILASLVRAVGDLQVAQDAVQEASIAALRDWPVKGVPSQPRVWLTVTARHKAIDMLRREGARADKEREAVDLKELSTSDLPPDSVVRDDQLRLIFTCCHPALAPEARVSLALKALCGLSTAQVAAVMLTGEAAMAKRLTRTKEKISKAKIPYRVPETADLPARLTAVCGVVHALYTSGHATFDVDPCAEAVRLGRLLCGLLPDEPMPAAVLALLLLTEARRPSRMDSSGEIVALAEQDRTAWDTALIAEGLTLLEKSLRRTEGVADPYQLQAAIAAEHARAPSYPDTDWPEIVRLYDLLLGVAPSPAARLARAVAVSETRGAAAGLAALEGIDPDPRWHAVRAELLARLGRFPEAVAAVDDSLRGEVAVQERTYRERQRARWATRL
ncbi:MAG TPA: DUF6596 domain-containing protein [Candidatus Limnocylindrales bacterium]|nr:DUF6596 domain-containing protein [Candidatus Limnocylindrales bacterium]